MMQLSGQVPATFRCRSVADVTVVDVAGPLDTVAPDLDRAVLHALAEEPRGVVCDLSAALDGIHLNGLDLLASSSREAREWRGTPVAVTCPDAALRAVLRRHPVSEGVMVRPTLRRALSDVAKCVAPAVARTRLAPRLTAGRAARDFVSRTCQTWGLRRGVASAALVASELVTNAVVHAQPDIDLSVARHGATLRLAVRDHSGGSPYQRGPSDDRTTGRGLLLVDGFARTWGVLPTADGGKVVWAVLDL
jgi:anti-sigma regulatory factor (Ser/Thr protein kinase)